MAITHLHRALCRVGKTREVNFCATDNKSVSWIMDKFYAEDYYLEISQPDA